MHKPPVNSIAFLITEGLGYCCEWFFFSRYSNTDMIATRLGVTPRAVRYHKTALEEGELHCEQCSNCMKRLLK